MISNPDLRS